jgi:hypothetical protein
MSVVAEGTNVYVATQPGGLAISTDSGASFTTRTTAQGLGHNNVYAVFVNGAYVYAGTNNGLSISTNSGASFVNKTTADGLGDNVVFGTLFVP